MGENEDDRLFVERGSSDCMPISVTSIGVSARTQPTDYHLLPAENEGRKYVSSVADTVSGSIENEFIDVGKTRDVSTPEKDDSLLDKGPINGLRKIGEVGISADSLSLRGNSKETRKFRFHCIAPRPFVASSLKRESTPLKTVVPNTNGCGAVCRTNNEPLIDTDKTILHFQGPSTDVNPLINDKTPDVIQTHITPGSLYESAVLVESRNSTETAAHEEKVRGEDGGTNNEPHAEHNVVNSTHQQILTGAVSVISSIRTKSDGENLKPSVTDGLPSAEYNSFYIGDFQNSFKQNGRINGVSDSPSDMGNNNTSSRRSTSYEEDFNETSSKSKQLQSTPFANPEVSADSEKESTSRVVPIPELIVSDSSMEQDISVLSIEKEKDQKDCEEVQQADDTDSVQPAKPQLRPFRSSDSAYSSDSRCTSMDSTTYQGGRGDDGEFCDQDTPALLLSPPVIAVDNKSVSSSSSSSSSPSHTQMGTSVASTDSLRVISEYGLQRKLSSSSGSSFRSSLSLESEDDMLSSDGEARDHFVGKGLRKQSRAQSSWAKIRRVVWSPFMQSFKKRYPWVQLAGHQGNFKPGEEGCILKKYCQREAECLSMLSHDVHLRPYAPEYHGLVDKDGERYTRMQDLLLAFDCPSVMDCKMGVRTYLEDELVKAKIKPRLRQDMYAKMTEISPNEPTPEEHAAKAVTKPRYMQWREHVSSSSNLGFRIEGIKKGGKDPSKDYKLTKTKEQVKCAFKYFIDEKSDVLDKYIKRLKDIRAAAEKSDFFMSHEVIGSSLLFVHDNTGIASAWMIDFGKTTQLPDNNRLTHREEWVEGNREDGYLFGLDNLIDIFEEILVDLTTGTKDNSAMKSSNATNETSTCQTPVISFSPSLSSQSSGESVDLTPKNNQSISLTESPRKPPLKRQVAATDSYDNSPQPNGAIPTPREKESTKNEGKDTEISTFDKT